MEIGMAVASYCQRPLTSGADLRGVRGLQPPPPPNDSEQPYPTVYKTYYSVP